MSKNFEDEYRQMIDREIPDLWNRIEARLPAQPPVSQTKEDPVPARKVFRMPQHTALILSAAAVLCLLFLLPGLLQKENRFPLSSDNAPAAENSVPQEIQGEMQDAAPAQSMASDRSPAHKTEVALPAMEEIEACAEAEPAVFCESDALQGILAVPNTEFAEQDSSMEQTEIRILEELQTQQGKLWYLAETLPGSERLLLRFAEEYELATQAPPAQPLYPQQICLVRLCPSDEERPSFAAETLPENLPVYLIAEIYSDPTD